MNTEIGRPSGGGPVANQTESKYTRVNLTFEGHFSAIQKTVTELEFRMPQITLESLNVAPKVQGNRSDELPNLKIQLNYLCWHRPN